jgi:DNA-binding NtrC family response regulator
MASILLFGLESDLADSLGGILRQQGHDVRVTDSIQMADIPGPHIVFAGGDGPDYREVVRRIMAVRPGMPVVLVNRHPENGRWLDALELGAADYCGAPFEPVQVQWVVNSVLREWLAAA